MPPGGRYINLTGKRFGRLIVVKFEKLKPNNGAFFLCQCDCGKKCIVRSASLRYGHTKSCGCLSADAVRARRMTHGKRYTKTYNSWCAMIQRCQNPKDKAYPRYGGRGINVCASWRESFAAFYADMGACPGGYTLERNDNNQGYSAANCRWATRTEQARNRRSNRRIAIDSHTRTIAEWAELSGIPYQTLANRVRRGWVGTKLLSVAKGDQ